MSLKIVLLGIILFLYFIQPILTIQANPTCGYAACDLGKPDMLNVHLIAHTHDDVGWLKSVNDYFYGDRNNVQHAGVQYIIDTAVRALLDDPNRRFIYVEIAFFYRWWNQQTMDMQASVRGLVNEGRLQFILGAWSMNDEASTHYVAIIDQHTRGLRFIAENFGDCGRPLASWQIDPFGHSREMASLFGQMGYDSLYFMRLDYQEKSQRLKNLTMEMLWSGSNDLGSGSTLFTGVLYESYCPPGGFCFDSLCSDAPIRDDPRLFPANVKQRISDFLKYAQGQSAHFTTNHIMIPMGCDFQFQNAFQNFKNIDKLVKYSNAMQREGSKINVIYSNPACYTFAVNQAKKRYTTKKDDFFPYASDSHSFWTGYFTSRPSLKGFVRKANNILQACQQLSIFSGITKVGRVAEQVDSLRRAMGILQHHDAVSGTEKQEVAYDYALMLSNGVTECTKVISLALTKLSVTSVLNDTSFEYCPYLNISSCPASEYAYKKPITIVVYNPLSQPRLHWVRIPVVGGVSAYSVRDSTGKPVASQMVPITKRTGSIPERGSSKSDFELVFQTSLPQLGYTTYTILPTKVVDSTSAKVTPFSTFDNFKNEGTDFIIKNELTQLSFNKTTGLLKEIQNLKKGYVLPMSVAIKYYYSFLGNNGNAENRSSGAYVFRPTSNEKSIFPTPVTFNTILGPLVQEVHQYFAPWASMVFRLYKGESNVEVEWTVGSIPDADGKGREVVIDYETQLKSEGNFFTDSNGRQMMMRERNKRSYPYNQTEQVSGNYYPINTRVLLGDSFGSKSLQLAILTDRSQGGGSVKDGQVEIMVHRRTTRDDGFGVGEPLRENGINKKGLIVRGKHFFRLDNVTDSWKIHRLESQKIFSEPIVTFYRGVPAMKHPTWSGLTRPLPANINWLTLDDWNNGSSLVRLEHLFESGEDPSGLSKAQFVDLTNIFTGTHPLSIEELTLAANQKLSDSKRLVWLSTDGSQTSDIFKRRHERGSPFNVTLSAMQIRTFKLNLAPIP